MEIIVTALLLLIFLVIVLVFINNKFTALTSSQKPNNDLLEVVRIMQRNSEVFTRRMDDTAKAIGGLQRNIGEMSEIGRGMKELQDFLKSPKLRGNIGEQILKELLGQMLPKNSFNLQYAFRSGDKVDAAITTSAGIIPIDSKFPMENFRKMMLYAGEPANASLYTESKNSFERDVKIHINSISSKYILTDEGTIDYALMYVPSESVYYEIVNNQDLFDYSARKRVLPVSPTTLYAYLRAILMSFEGQKIEEHAREILKLMRAVQTDYKKVEENISVLQKHLTNAYNMVGNVASSFAQLGQKIERGTEVSSGSGTKKLDI